jgi:hypothetical protein
LVTLNELGDTSETGDGDSDTETTETGEGDGDETGGDDDTGDGDGDDTLKIVGSYTDNWNTDHTISSAQWDIVGTGSFDVSVFDNEAEFVIAQNASTNDFNPDMWSRFDIAYAGNDLYYCQTGYGEANEQDALDLPRSDDSAPATTGCGGEFGWTLLASDDLEIAGAWEDDWAQAYALSDSEWSIDSSTYAITSFDSTGNFLIAQNDSGNEFNADLWSRLDWTYVGNALYVCQSAYDAATEQDAIDTVAADANDPATEGCGGEFPWSLLN